MWIHLPVQRASVAAGRVRRAWLHRRRAPCNQFKGQEPGSDEDIAEFCSLNFGVDFPLLAKLEVNGEGTHPLYEELKAAEDAEGQAGDVAWNFEKFLIDVDGAVVGRVRPVVEPQDASVVECIEENLPA